MKFTADMTDGFERTWQRCEALAGWRPNTWLEVGTYEGRSACWMIENKLQPGSCLVTIDPFDAWGDHRRSIMQGIADGNLQDSAARHKVAAQVVAGVLDEDTAESLRVEYGAFDGAYLDGPKDYVSALEASRLAWSLVKPGGVVIWDDVHWNEEQREHRREQLGPIGQAVATLLEEQGLSLADAVWHETQIAVVKPGPPKRCVLSIACGEACVEEHSLTAANHRDYAEFCGAEWIEIVRPDLSLAYGPAAKFVAADVARDFDQTLFLDSDCVVMPKAPNIFDEVPPDHWGVVDEMWPLAAKCDPHKWQGEADAICDAAGMPRVEMPFSINSGVMVLPREASLYAPPPKPVPWFWCVEQLWLSAELVCHEAPYTLLDPRWNWCYWFPEFEAGGKEAFIVHINAERNERRALIGRFC
jgi:predicted O-methyltransferase YrrM